MSSKLVIAVVVCIVLTTSAYAQFGGFSPRAAAMGGASIGVADDYAAWAQNPAGLGNLKAMPLEGNEYGSDVLAAYADFGDDSDGWGLTWSGWNPEEKLGFGAGYFDAEDLANAWGFGFGAAVGDTKLSLGINLQSVDFDFGGLGLLQSPTYCDSETLFNVGAMYQFGGGVKLGVLVADFGQEFANRTYNAGIAWPINDQLLLAADVLDIGEDNGDVLFNGGLEYKFGSGTNWAVRVGAMDTADDHNLTLGLGLGTGRWHVDAAWVDSDPDSMWAAGVGTTF